MNSSSLKFSALGSVYAEEKVTYLDQALQSLYNQTLPANEIVLIYDGILTRELYYCLEKWKEILSFKVIKLKECRGLSHALNLGIKECSHEWIARFDTDDINRLYRFEKQMDYLKHEPHTIVLSSDIEEFNKTPGDLNRVRATVYSHEEIVLYAKIRNPMNHPSIVFKKCAALSVGGYSKDLPYMQDYDLWLRMMAKGYKFANIPACLVDYRAGNRMMAKRRGIAYAKLEFALYKTKRRLGFNPQLSVFFLRAFSRLLPFPLLSSIYHLLRKYK